MELRVQIVAIVAMATLFVLVFELVRQRRLMERYALLWMAAVSVLLALAVWRDLLELFSGVIGIAYAPSALFVVALGAIGLLLLHFSLVISRLTDQSKVLAQRVGMLQQRVDELEAGRAEADADDPEAATEAPVPVSTR